MKKILIALIILWGAAWAQFHFGKNKIQPFDYRWEVLSTPHFDIYYYTDEEKLARIAGEIAERTYTRYTAHWGFAPRERVPIVLYSSPVLFAETHTVPFIIPEGIGGFTEYIKGRVILPYTGSLADFEHILPHELVHIWQFHYDEFLHDAHELFFMDFPPLWFVEGQAELLSQPQESHDERTEIIADLANDRFVLPTDFDRIAGTYQMYKEGESFLRFLNRTFGDRTDVRLFERVWEHGFFDDVFKTTLGITLEEAGLLWRQDLRRRFGEYIAARTPAKTAGKILTPEGYFFSPFRIDSVTIICKGNKLGYAGIYQIRRGRAKLVKKIELTESAEATHLFNNRIALCGDSLVAFSAKSGGYDALFVWNRRSGRTHKFQFDDVVEISSPWFSPDGETIFFSGARKSGFADIFSINLRTGTLKTITDDHYSDRFPVCLGDSAVLFVSDRGDSLRMGFVLYNPARGTFTDIVLPGGLFRPAAPFSDGEKLYFVADDDTFPDIYMLDLGTDSVFRLSRITEPVYDVFPCGETLLVSANTDRGIGIYAIAIPDTPEFVGKVSKRPSGGWWELPAQGQSLYSGEKPKKPNAHRLTFDLAQGEVSTVSGQENGGGIEIALSDMMGDRRIYAFFADYAQSLSELLSEANFALVYSRYGTRWTASGGIFHFHLRSYDRYEGAYDEHQAGILASASYAFSRFVRTQLDAFAYYSDRGEYWSPRRKDFILSANLSLIRDNAIWGATGPLDGMRANITAGAGVGASGTLYHYLISADLRRYLRLSRSVCWANRVIARHSDGPEPQRFYMGGTWDFRGYPYFYFYGKNQFLFNSELRFPLVNRFYLSTPLLRIDIRGIRGAVFFDAGDAWEDSPNIVGSFGVGARMNLGGYTVLRLDFAQTTDFHTIDPHWRWDIFFGWDF